MSVLLVISIFWVTSVMVRLEAKMEHEIYPVGNRQSMFKGCLSFFGSLWSMQNAYTFKCPWGVLQITLGLLNGRGHIEVHLQVKNIYLCESNLKSLKSWYGAIIFE